MNSITLTDEFRALVPGAAARRSGSASGWNASVAQPVRVERHNGQPLRFEGEPLLSVARASTLESGMMLHVRLFAGEGHELILLLERSIDGGRPRLVRALRGTRGALLAQDFTRFDATSLLAVPLDILTGDTTEAVLAAHAELGRRIAQIRADFASLCAEIFNPSPDRDSHHERSEPCLD